MFCVFEIVEKYFEFVLCGWVLDFGCGVGWLVFLMFD